MVIDDNQNKNNKEPQSVSVNEVLSNESAEKGQLPLSQLYAGTSDSTDGRKRYDWLTKYPCRAWLEIIIETIYLFILLNGSLYLIFATWKGLIGPFLSVPPEQTKTLNKYSYYLASGMLGGVIFDMKFLYRVVARGFWNQDRRIWRAMSPFVAMTIAFMIGVMIDAGLLHAKTSVSSATIVTIGFLAGYFADHAVGKMAEIAMVIFGKSAVVKDRDSK